MEKLVIVESPEKAKSIQNILNKKEWKVVASRGYIEDLPEEEIGVYIHKNKVEVVFKKKPNAESVIKEINNPDVKVIYIATDPDREGEGIAFQIRKYIKDRKVRRVRFYELTPSHILNSFEKAENDIDYNLAEAQITRRVVDRLIGYILSLEFIEFFKKEIEDRNVPKGLSIGRVQVPTIYFIKKRIEEIENHLEEKRWAIEVLCSNTNFISKSFSAVSSKTFPTLVEARKHLKIFDNVYTVKDIKHSFIKFYPPQPLTTVELQKKSYQRYGFTASKTMKIAQSLYEKGHCTYIRTASDRVSEEGRKIAQEFIIEKFGRDYLKEEYPYENETEYKKNKEAHESIRPTSKDFDIRKLNDAELKILSLIRENFYASQMKEALYKQTLIELDNKGNSFFLKGKTCVFDGYMRLTKENLSEFVPQVEKGQKLLGYTRLKCIKTKKPEHYNEATLLEEISRNGIGRPSSYAGIIESISKLYVKKDKKGRLITTPYADKMLEFLNKRNYSFLIYPEFTQRLEYELDLIAEGKKKKEDVIIDLVEGMQKVNINTPLFIKRGIRR